MSPILITTVIVLYFSALMLISFLTSRKADTDSFFVANRQAPWYLVAFGMIGTSLSGVTFISVPGSVGVEAGGELKAFSYFQIVLGNLFGYLVIAKVLLPIYYKYNLVSIYSYLERRFGFWAYKSGAFFFLVSRSIGSALRLSLAAMVLHLFLFKQWDVPFLGTVAITILLIWIYTYRGGLKTIIWTDTFQTFFLVSALIISVYMISDRLGMSLSEMVGTIDSSSYSKIFFLEDFKSDKFFLKQFIAGMFLAIAMYGLDQDLMQKNLSCKSLKDAQKNIYWFSGIIVGINLLFLALGALLYLYATKNGIAIPTEADELFPLLALNEFGLAVGVFFLLGIIASSYASSDSALAALTTSFCVDFLDFKKKEEKQKKKEKFLVHIGFSLVFLCIIVIFQDVKKATVLYTIFTVAAYTYGPLLGLFSFGLFNRRPVNDKYTPIVCIVSPVLTFIINYYSESLFGGYKFSFELLLINGLICFLGLWMISSKEVKEEPELTEEVEVAK